jgi:hypothetical protein
MRRAALRGLALVGVLLASAGLVATIEAVASGFAYRPWTWVKVAFVYAAAAMGAEVRVQGLSTEPLTIHLVPLTITFGVLALAFRWSRGGAKSAAEVALTTAVVAASVSVGASVARLVFPQLEVTVTVVVWMAAVGTTLLIGAAGIAGLVAGDERGPARARDVVAGAWRMVAWTVLAGAVAFVLLAAAKPSATEAYGRWLGGLGATGGVLALHHALLLPNQALLQAVPSMGGCLEATVEESMPPRAAELCAGGNVVVAGSFVGLVDVAAMPRQPSETAAIWGVGGLAWAFLVVPLIATVGGGVRATRSARDAAPPLRVGLGAASGAVFAGMLVIAWRFAFLAGPIPLPGLMAPVTVAPDHPQAFVLAVGWGVLGGALGALAAPWLDRRREGSVPAE